MSLTSTCCPKRSIEAKLLAGRFHAACLLIALGGAAFAADPALTGLPIPGNFQFSPPVPARGSGDCRGPQYWLNEIDVFLSADAVSMPPAGGVLFMGSSSIRMWDLKKYFADMPAINRGFGGSCLDESTFYFDKIAVPYRPRLIVLYSGENDIAASKTGDEVASDLDKFLAAVRERLPGVHVIYLSIKPSPARWPLWPEMRSANTALKASCEAAGSCLFIDAASPMLGPDGKPRPELFGPDGLHMNDNGYRLWTGLLQPLLQDY